MAAHERLLFDVLLVGVLMVVVVVGSSKAAAFQLDTRRRPDAVAYALVVLATTSLLGRRWWPRAVFAATVTITVVYLALRYPYGPVLFTVVIALYTLASRLPWQQSLVACSVALGVTLGVVLVDRPSADLGSDLLHAMAFSGWLVAPWSVGLLARVRAETLQQVRAERLHRHVSEERLAIAREIHDVVGHGLAVITMQAGIALHLIDRLPEQAKPALEAIHRSSKDALEELRATLSVFRAADGDGRPAGPSLRRLDDLVATMADSGLPVRLEISGVLGGLPTATDRAAYRVVQESLTNVLRHSGPDTTTRIRVLRRPQRLVVEVTDDGDGTSTTRGDTGGHGIPGMRERCLTLGGTFAAGPRQGGGFRVRAVLPIKEVGE